MIKDLLLSIKRYINVHFSMLIFMLLYFKIHDIVQLCSGLLSFCLQWFFVY